MYGKEQTEKLRGILKKKKLDALLLINYTSDHVDKNFHYFTGIEWVEHSFAIITKDSEKLYLPKFEIDRCAPETWIKDIEELPKKKSFETITGTLKKKKIGINGGFLTANTFQKLKTKKVVDLGEEIRKLRMIKTREEIEFLRQAVRITESFYHNINFSATEQEIAAEIQDRATRAGGKLAFDSIVAYDGNSALPHAKVTNGKGSKVLLIDSGAAFKGYHADVTRTLPVKEDKEFEKTYGIVKDVQERAIDMVEPGVKANKIDKFVRNELKGKGFEFIHSTGHGIGLEIHEAPAISEKSKDILKENMVHTIEPGIYLKGKFGVRIEDDVLVKKNGCEVLTKNIEK